jgi:tetratricopeptide (TPR) repeat protein
MICFFRSSIQKLTWNSNDTNIPSMGTQNYLLATTYTMNYLKFHLFVLLCLMLASCQPHYTHNETILKAESLLYTAPDSAYRLLLSIKHPEKLPKGDYAAWCLNYTHVQYKLYMQFKSDSIINIAINYYSDKDLPKYSGTAYYLSGCIAVQFNQNKKAMLAFKQANNLLKNTKEDNLKGLVDFNIGHAYFQDDLSYQSLHYYEESFRYFKRAKNKLYQAYAYRAISDLYCKMDYPFEKVIHYTDIAIQLSKEAGDSINYYNNIVRKGELFSVRDYSKSIEFLLKGYYSLSTKKSECAAFLSTTYSKLNQMDSARYYLKVALKDTLTLNQTLINNIAGAYVAKGEGNLNQAFHYLEKAYNTRDTITQKSILNQLYRIDKQYDLEQKEKENARLKIANQRQTIVITVLTIVVLVVLLILLLIRIRNKQKQAAYEIEKQRLEFEVTKKKIENEQKRQLLLAKLKSRIENTLQFNRLKMGWLQQDKHEEFVAEITKQAVIAVEEWQYYIDEVNHLFDGRIASLKTEFATLTLNDLIVTALICLDVDISNCCSLLDISSNTMYNRRKRIKSRVGIDKDIDLEDWIMTYVNVVNSKE